MKTFKFLLLILISFFFISCSTSAVFQYSTQTNTLFLGDSNSPVKVEFSDPKYRGSIHKCTSFPYTINDDHSKYGKLFVESISLYDVCNWNGFPLGLLESKIRFLSEVKSMKTVETVEVNNYVFKTYLVNEKEYLSIMYIYGLKDTFIVDDEGILYAEVLKSFDENYVDMYGSKPRYSSNYNKSMVRDNIMHHYFEREPIDVE
ncbi:MAG: hypothetical protein HRT43_09920 [Campylobacteraceae bacterium]|nr:hypothetical protein [Campylobacteraceae bacterium]